MRKLFFLCPVKAVKKGGRMFCGFFSFCILIDRL